MKWFNYERELPAAPTPCWQPVRCFARHPTEMELTAMYAQYARCRLVEAHAGPHEFRRVVPEHYETIKWESEQ